MTSGTPIETLQDLIQIPSVNGEHNEGEIIDFVKSMCDRLGLENKVFEFESGRPNLYIGTPGQFNNPNDLLLVAHADTVAPGDISLWSGNPYDGHIDGDRIYGRGAIDCKGGIAVGLHALSQILHTGAQAKMIITADEEAGANSDIGLRGVLNEGLDAKGALYLYGGPLSNKLIIGHRGNLRIKVRCTGEQTHSGSRSFSSGEKGANALEGNMKFGLQIQDLLNTIKNNTGDEEYFPGLGFISTITESTATHGVSIVPGMHEITFDIRTIPGHHHDEIISLFNELAGKLSLGKLSYEVSVTNNIPSTLTDTGSLIVQNSVHAMKTLYGYPEIELRASGAANEMHMLNTSGIPTVVGFGPDGDNFHGIDEYAVISSLENSIRGIKMISGSLAQK